MTVEYRCEGCFRDICDLSGEPVPQPALCRQCRMIGPKRSRALNDWQDGIIGDDEFKLRYGEGEGPQAP